MDAQHVDPEQAAIERDRMVEAQIRARGVKDPRVLDAMRTVPRHLFVPPAARGFAYEDRPLPIGLGQTISQPYIVAVMTELADPQPGDRVLEVGTGSGYGAAVLSRVVTHVYTIEIIPELAKKAHSLLADLDYDNVTAIEGDGYQGLPAHAPFDAIVVTAAPDEVPPALLEQLALGGKLVIPVGTGSQTMQVLERTTQGVRRSELFEVRFVPMTGAGKRKKSR